MLLIPSALKASVASLCVLMLVTTAESGSLKPRLNAQNFFEVLDPSHPRDPAWPERLTLEVDPNVTLQEFKELLTHNRWRTSYNCEGKPTEPNDDLFDGTITPYQDSIYDQTTFTRMFYWEKTAATGKPSHVETEASKYRIDHLTTGEFWISFPDEEFFATGRYVATVKETGERVLISSIPLQATCSNGEPVQTVLIPVEQNSF